MDNEETEARLTAGARRNVFHPSRAFSARLLRPPFPSLPSEGPLLFLMRSPASDEIKKDLETAVGTLKTVRAARRSPVSGCCRGSIPFLLCAAEAQQRASAAGRGRDGAAEGAALREVQGVDQPRRRLTGRGRDQRTGQTFGGPRAPSTTAERAVRWRAAVVVARRAVAEGTLLLPHGGGAWGGAWWQGGRVAAAGRSRLLLLCKSATPASSSTSQQRGAAAAGAATVVLISIFDMVLS